ncbi:NUDIX hydrolase [Patescibacteria group bacterium]|nr:NUDIX hydrolase [Patescibacteria group bacterium]
MNNKTTFTWHPNKILNNIKPFQVYGFCLNKNNLIALVRDKGENRFTLPGGKIDNNESPIQALIREFKEEVQFIPEKIELLGSLEVQIKDKYSKIIDHHQQIRFICHIKNPGSFVPEKDGWETVERIFVKPQNLPDYLEWIVYPTGKIQFKELLKRLDKKSSTP